MSLRCGITTGACAAAAAKAAASALVGEVAPREVQLRLPSGETARVPILGVQHVAGSHVATATVRKDAGDDPDVTHGLEVRVTVSWDDAAGVMFVAGEGVGMVTKPGLQVPPGQPAVNPVPRQMIAAAVREITSRGVRVEIAIPGGREIASRTFNPRLGIEGGLSILGTTGRVRPYCTRALREALTCAINVAAACQVAAPVLVPGNIGVRAASQHFALRDEQIVEVGNEWGFLLDLLPGRDFLAVLIVGHPGKLAKLAADQWDTHSSRSSQATQYVDALCSQVVGHPAPNCPTTEGMFAKLASPQKTQLADALADRVRSAVAARLANRLPVAVFLVDMAGQRLGTDGDLSPWL